jgi:two-component system response regulator YesN
MYELLIVDDENFVVENLATTYPWQDLGIRSVHTAHSASEALQLMQYHNIHIMITDIKMPGLSGLELIHRVQVISSKTKCILLSGHTDFHYAQQAITSKVQAYLLKPVKEEELLTTVGNVIHQIEQEWSEIVSHQNTLYTLNEHLPQLRESLLYNLLQGKYFPQDALDKKLEMLKLPIQREQAFGMMFIRLEEGFQNYDDYSRSLLEFGITNIIEEIFCGHFYVWQCKDIHDYLICVLTDRAEESSGDRMPHQQLIKTLEKLSLQLQDSVATFLKGNISVLISDWGHFPVDIYPFYQQSMSVIRKHPDNTEGYFISSIKQVENAEFQPLRSMSEPPSMLNLFEAGRWDAAAQKWESIIQELNAQHKYEYESYYEVALMLSFSVYHTVHKQGKPLENLVDLPPLVFSEQEMPRVIDNLDRWGREMIDALRNNTMKETKGNQYSIILKVQEYVQQHLESDVSLQTMADHVYLHPAYLSKIYKLETGEGLSDYIYRLRMERAAHFLNDSNEKIHEISKKSGYQNPSHFSRVFKKYFNMTPEEFRGRV